MLMNRLSNVGRPRSCPPRALGEVGPDLASDATDSGVFQLFESSVLVFASPGEDLRLASDALEDSGFSVVVVPESARVEDLAFVPRFAVIETGLPGAFDLLRSIARPDSLMQVLVLLAPGEPEGPALAAGATLTLRRPPTRALRARPV